MKARTFFTTGIFLSVALALLCFVADGCKSPPKVDWNSRVGVYTYDQAVVDLGPPDKKETLTDGKIVAVWMRRRETHNVSIGLGTGGYIGSGAAVGGGGGTSTGSYSEKVTTLTFGKDGKLLSWSKNY